MAQGRDGGFDAAALVIGLGAGFVLFRLKWGVIPVIGAAAATGLAWTLVRDQLM